LLGWGAWLLIRAWTWSLRYRRLGPPIVGPGLVAFWHGDQLPLLGQRPMGDVVAPISASRDGRLQAAILGRLGVGDVPGSSSRGGAAAARGLLRALSRGAVALMAVDGPRGPRGLVKPGVVYLAGHVGAPVFPVAVAVARGRRLRRAWDRYLLPLPFTRTVVVVGEPLHFTRGDDLEAGALALAERLERLGAEARAAL
jgi:lysophospholipid acyltransferase (LPLAT)-like uncharacterized protein